MNKAAKFVVREIPVVTHEELAGLGTIQELEKVGTGDSSITIPFRMALGCWRKMTKEQRADVRLVYGYFQRMRKQRN